VELNPVNIIYTMSDTNQDKPVRSLSEFIDKLNSKMNLINKFGDNSEEYPVWFRGEGSEKYELVPNLYRYVQDGKTYYWNDIVDCKIIKRIEDNIDINFNRKATIYLADKKIANIRWNRYFLQQHYKIKTRLLDWTENALYALFFALADQNNNYNARVWLLSPQKLNNYSLQKLTGQNVNRYHIFSSFGDLEKKELINEKGELNWKELMRKYCLIDFSRNDKAHPIAIYPLHLDDRMAAQQACFTIYGNVVKGLLIDDSVEKFLEYVLICANSKEKILKELRLIGVSNYSIYPDLDGLGRTINDDHLHDILNGRERNDLNYLKKPS
jgi:hypothetical protein